jgi:hypothetical protein
MLYGKLALAALCLVTASSVQAQTIYSAADFGAGPGNSHPNSDNKAAQFDAAAGALGTESLINFESAPVGSVFSLTVAPGVVLSGADFQGNPQGIDDTPNFPPAPALGGFNTTLGGKNFVDIQGGTATFTFSSPIQAFAAYFTGVQTAFFQDTITFNDGTIQSINVPGSADTSLGGVGFAGFTDPGKLITTITITASNNAGVDFIGIDDVRFVTPTTAVPEPGSVALLIGLGISSSVFVRRRKNSRQAA